MKKCINGIFYNLTDEESTVLEQCARVARIEECRRPLTELEVLQIFVAQQINSLSVDDNTAIRMKQFFPTFDSLIGQTLPHGHKFQYGDKLWSVVQPELTIQAHYPPGPGMESLYAEICEMYTGTLDDPIPYDGNMALEAGKYYLQNHVIYLCIRDTGNPVYHALSDLTGIYVTAV